MPEQRRRPEPHTTLPPELVALIRATASAAPAPARPAAVPRLVALPPRDEQQ